MFDLNTNKHDSFDEACLRFASSTNVQELAMQCGIKPQVLRNKLNPDQPHQLTVRELVAISKNSEDLDLINTVLMELEMTVVRLPKQSQSKAPVITAMAINSHAGEISRHIVESENDKRLTRQRKNEIVKKARYAMRELVLLINDIEHRSQGSTPFISMCTEAVVNGLPLPGLM